MNPAIFIPSYPNTPYKISILKECILSVKKTGIPVILISNMDLPEDVCILADGYIRGNKEDCRYLDFLTPDQIDFARNSSIYLLHFVTPDGETIHYKPFSYGRGSTYHWEASLQQIDAVKYSRENGITHAFMLEGDVVLDERDVHVIPQKFSQMEKEGIEFIIPMNPISDQISGNVWFISTEYLEKICEGMSPSHFLNSTYPSFSAERYIMKRMEKSGGNGIILSHSSYFRSITDFTSLWHPVEVDTLISDPTPVNLIFPHTKKIGLSSNIDRKDQDPSDPLTYIFFGIGEKSGHPVFFIRNVYDEESVQKIRARICIFNDDFKIFESEYDLPPGYWAWDPIFNIEINSHCEIEIETVDKEGKIFTLKDRFGSVGGSINMGEHNTRKNES